MERQSQWCQAIDLFININKTKELVAEFRRKPRTTYTALTIKGTPRERVSSFRYHDVHQQGAFMDSANFDYNIEGETASLPSTQLSRGPSTLPLQRTSSLGTAVLRTAKPCRVW